MFTVFKVNMFTSKSLIMKINRKIKLTGLFLVTLLFGFLIFSCRSGSKKVSEKIMEHAIENATGKDAKVNFNKEKTVIESGGNRFEVDSKASTWPKEIPMDVPEFSFGQIEAVTTSTVDGANIWTIAFKDVKDGFIEKYEARLKEKGFETTVIKTGDKAGSIMAETAKYNIFLMGGEGNVSLSINPKKPE